MSETVSSITSGDVIISVGTAVLIIAVVRFLIGFRKKDVNLPPHVPHWVPYFGSIVDFAKNPVAFIAKNAEKYGDIFTATILGRSMTFLTHQRAFDVFFKAYDDELGLREVYRFMKPVFGKGVVYDAESSEMMMEQLRFVTTGFTVPRFRLYTGILEEEAKLKFEKMGDSGTCDVLDSLGDLIIYTASRCLLGSDIRYYLEDKNLGKLYHDLDEGISALSFFYPWLPSPQRDRACKAVFSIFQQLIDERRKNMDKRYEDVLDTLLRAKYKNGSELPDAHICGILLAGLFAGQHTSSIASSWTLMLILTNPDIYQKVMEEQRRVLEGDLEGTLNYDKVKEMDYLERCLKESLRMFPPLIMLMRYVKKERHYKDMTIPEGNILIVSPSQSGRVPDVWSNPDKFDPDRFIAPRLEHEKTNHALLAFGSGRHKCVGEQFALLQIKSILSCMLRYYEMKMLSPLPAVSYVSMVAGPTAPRIMEYKKRTSW